MLHRSNESVAICLKMYLRVIDSVTKHGKVSLDHFKSILKSNMNSYLNKEGGGGAWIVCTCVQCTAFLPVCICVYACVCVCARVLKRDSSGEFSIAR